MRCEEGSILTRKQVLEGYEVVREYPYYDEDDELFDDEVNEEIE